MYELDWSARSDPGLAGAANTTARVLPSHDAAFVADVTGRGGRARLAGIGAAIEREFAAPPGVLEVDEAVATVEQMLAGVHRLNDEEPGTISIAVAMIADAHAVVGSVGTTRCYLVRAGGVDRLAIDPARGSGVSWLSCEPGAVYVMCSTGVWSVIDASRLTAAVAETDSSDALCDRLVGAAWAGGGLASLGVAVIRVVSDQPRLVEPPWTTREAAAP